MSDRDKDAEILALRHQLLVLQRQAGKPTFTGTDRAVLAGLLHHLPMDKLRHLLLLVHPDTILRWHRNLLKRRHAGSMAVTALPGSGWTGWPPRSWRPAAGCQGHGARCRVTSTRHRLSSCLPRPPPSWRPGPPASASRSAWKSDNAIQPAGPGERRSR